MNSEPMASSYDKHSSTLPAPSSVAALLADAYSEVESLRRDLAVLQKRTESAERIATALQVLHGLTPASPNNPPYATPPSPAADSPSPPPTLTAATASRLLLEFEARATQAEAQRDEADARCTRLADTFAQHLSTLDSVAADARLTFSRIVLGRAPSNATATTFPALHLPPPPRTTIRRLRSPSLTADAAAPQPKRRRPADELSQPRMILPPPAADTTTRSRASSTSSMSVDEMLLEASTDSAAAAAAAQTAPGSPEPPIAARPATSTSTFPSTFRTHIFAPPVTGAPTKRPAKHASWSAPVASGSDADEVAAQGAFPAANAAGQRLCRQCGATGRQKDGKCVEKWGPGPLGPGTVCDRCRKKTKRVARRGTMPVLASKAERGGKAAESAGKAVESGGKAGEKEEPSSGDAVGLRHGLGKALVQAQQQRRVTTPYRASPEEQDRGVRRADTLPTPHTKLGFTNSHVRGGPLPPRSTASPMPPRSTISPAPRRPTSSASPDLKLPNANTGASVTNITTKHASTPTNANTARSPSASPALPSEDSIPVSSMREDSIPISAMRTGSDEDERSRKGEVLQRTVDADMELLEAVDAAEADIASSREASVERELA